MRPAVAVIVLAGALLAAGCTHSKPKPNPTGTPPRDGLGIAITSSKAEYRSGERIALSVQLTSGLTRECRVSQVAEGGLAITSLTRDGTPIAPVLVNGSYIGGFAEFLAAHQAPLAPGGSVTVPWTSEGGSSPDDRAALPTSTLDSLDQVLIGYWPVGDPGKYELSARYAGTAGDCPGTEPAQVTFTVTGS